MLASCALLWGCAPDAAQHEPGCPHPGSGAGTPRLTERAGTGASGVGSESRPTPEFVELAPGLRVDRGRGVVEFDGRVAVDCHDPDTPDVWLELIVTSPDTREHEALVVTEVRPSLIHAALLAAGAEPGAPGRVDVDATGKIVRTDAVGAQVAVWLVIEGDEPIPPFEWIRSAHDPSLRSKTRSDSASPDVEELTRFVFAGSRVVEYGGRRVYDADGTGVVIGLTTFGSEVVALRRAVSPESSVDAPGWMARNEVVPGVGMAVRVRLVVLKQD